MSAQAQCQPSRRIMARRLLYVGKQIREKAYIITGDTLWTGRALAYTLLVLLSKCVRKLFDKEKAIQDSFGLSITIAFYN